MAVEPGEGRSTKRRLIPLLLVVAVVFAIVVQRLRSPEEGSGSLKPVVTVDFPANVEAGSVNTAIVTVENPSASDIPSLFVSFSLLGTAAGERLPTPIVGGPSENGQPAIVSIDPEPIAEGAGVRFGFGELASGDEVTIEFELRAPEITGPAANSVVAYDGELADRSGGASLETTVEP